MAENNNQRRPFSIRGLSSLLITWAFLLLTVSGVILYAAPRGSTAHRIDWTLLGLDRQQWIATHVVMAVLFLVAAIFHIAYNMRMLLHHCVGSSDRSIPVTPEFGVSLVILIVVLALIGLNTAPVEWIYDVRHTLRDRYEERNDTSHRTPQQTDDSHHRQGEGSRGHDMDEIGRGQGGPGRGEGGGRRHEIH